MSDSWSWLASWAQDCGIAPHVRLSTQWGSAWDLVPRPLPLPLPAFLHSLCRSNKQIVKKQMQQLFKDVEPWELSQYFSQKYECVLPLCAPPKTCMRMFKTAPSIRAKNWKQGKCRSAGWTHRPWCKHHTATRVDKVQHPHTDESRQHRTEWKQLLMREHTVGFHSTYSKRAKSFNNVKSRWWSLLEEAESND